MLCQFYGFEHNNDKHNFWRQIRNPKLNGQCLLPSNLRRNSLFSSAKQVIQFPDFSRSVAILWQFPDWFSLSSVVAILKGSIDGRTVDGTCSTLYHLASRRGNRRQLVSFKKRPAAIGSRSQSAPDLNKSLIWNATMAECWQLIHAVFILIG